MDDLDLFAQNPVFALLDKSSQEKLLANAISRQYRAGEWVLHHGEIWPYLFLVAQGSIKAVKESVEGRSLIIETLEVGELLWGVAFFDPQTPMPVALVAAADSRLLLWSVERARPILEQNGAALWVLCQLMIDRMQHASALVDKLAFQPVAGRLARLLVDRFAEIPGERVSRDMTLDEMAGHIGSTREMVSRILHRFAAQGMIEITRTEFSFCDWGRLSQIADKTPE